MEETGNENSLKTEEGVVVSDFNRWFEQVIPHTLEVSGDFVNNFKDSNNEKLSCFAKVNNANNVVSENMSKIESEELSENENSESSNFKEEKGNISLVYLKNKINVPPRSKILVEVKCSNKNFINNDDIIVIEPIAQKFRKGVLVSRSICSQEHGLFVSLINFSDNAVNLNKGMRVAKAEKFSENNNIDQNVQKVCCNINTQPPIATFDHADLAWDSQINLDHLNSPIKEEVQDFLNKNKDVFAESVLDLPGCDTIQHTITLTDDRPVRSRAYRVPHNLKQEMENQLDMLLKANIIEPSMSEFSSPVILVKKSDGSYRLAVDYRKLNKKLVKDAYPIPNITDSVDALTGSQFFSTLDLTSGFFQQVVDPKDRHKTAIITHKGLFQFNRSSFGNATASNGFQRLMNAIFGDLGNLGILVYIDDIVIASTDIKSHFKKLNTVFERLRQHKLKLKPNKCVFLSDKIQYLGFEIQKGQVAPINKNIEIIKNFEAPKSRKAVRSFIGTANFYRKFLPDFTKRAKNLINLTKDNGRFKWTDAAQSDFEDLKAALISKPCLALPDFAKTFHLYTDASGEALGAVLCQLDEENLPHPVAFASRKLKDAETRYSATERELMALVWATSHFKCYLACNFFYVYTDHAPLTYMLKIQDPTSRMAKWICTLSDFQFETKFIIGKINTVADFLSRFVNNSCNYVNTVKYTFCAQVGENHEYAPHNDLLEKIQELQKTDFKCVRIVKKLGKNEEIAPKYMRFFLREDILVCEDTRETPVIGNSIKLVVPKELVPQVFALTHESLAACHQGFQKTIERIREHFYWSGMSVHVRNLVDSCVSCQQRRAHKSNQLAPLQRMPTPNYPIAKVHVDCLGPFTTTMSGNKYIIAYIDAFSKWPEAYAVSSITTEAVAETLADFISRYGAPRNITTDRGSNFVSRAIEKIYQQFGINHITTTAFHPAGNAQIERQNRTLANALSHIVDENQLDWDSKLKFALLAMRTSVHSSTKLTPAAVLYGRNLNLPYAIFSQPIQLSYNDVPSYCELLLPSLQKVYSQVHNNLIKVSENQEKYREKTAVHKNLKVGDSVWLFTPTIKKNLSRKLSKQNSGPFTIIEKLSEVNFKIALETNLSKTQIVHVDRLNIVKNRLHFPNSPSKQTDSYTELPAAGNSVSLADPVVSPAKSNVEINRFTRRKRPKFFAFPTSYAATRLSGDSETGDQRTESAVGTQGETAANTTDRSERESVPVEREKEDSQDLVLTDENVRSPQFIAPELITKLNSRRGTERSVLNRSRSVSSGRYSLRKTKHRTQSFTYLE